MSVSLVATVTEGEKKADVLAAAAPSLSVVATTTGASATPGELPLSVLEDRDVTLWPDFDPQGIGHMKRIVAALKRLARSVRTIDVEALGLPEKGDAVEWLESVDAVEDVGPLVLSLKMVAEDSSLEPVSVFVLLGRIYVGKRFGTGIVPLDEILKGGLAPGFLFVVGGEPWIGKTTFLAQLADALSRVGVVVFIWAADEAAVGLALRLGQLQGEEQNELNPNYPTVLDRVREAIGDRVRFIPETCATVEQATEIALAHSPDGADRGGAARLAEACERRSRPGSRDRGVAGGEGSAAGLLD